MYQGINKSNCIQHISGLFFHSYIIYTRLIIYFDDPQYTSYNTSFLIDVVNFDLKTKIIY